MSNMILCLLLPFFLFGSGQQAQNLPDTDTRTQIASLAAAFLQETKAPGLSIAMRLNGETVYAQGFGEADRDNHLPMHTSTRLRTASVAKVITATALGVLASEGKLDFDAPIKRYVPYIPEAYAELTTRQLAGHTAGVAHRPKGEAYKRKHYETIRETALLMKAAPIFEADTDYSYSTHAFNFLGAVVEGASGQSYVDYLEAVIFKKLQMIHTAPENIDSLTQKDARLYSVTKGKLRKAKLTNGSYKLPGAGFRSTPSDLVKMMDAYTNGMISQAVVADMFQSHEINDGQKTFVGIGWRTAMDPFGHRVIEHAGSWHGTRTVLVHYPDENLQISLMVNADCQVLIEETAHLFAQLLRNQKRAATVPEKISEQLTLLMTSKDNEAYQGTLVLNGASGRLQTDKKGLLSDAPILNLGSEDDYAVATSYGLLYLQLKNEGVLTGKIYSYFNRSDTNPVSQDPLATFSCHR